MVSKRKKGKFKFGLWLEKQLERKGLSKQEFAKQIPCHYTYIWKLIKGEKQPSKSMAQRIGEVLGCPMEALIYAGFDVETEPTITPHTESDFSGWDLLLEWLHSEQIYTNGEIGAIRQIFDKMLEWYYLNKSALADREHHFLNFMIRALNKFSGGKEDVEQLSKDISIMLDMFPDPDLILSEEEKNLLPLLSTGVLERHEYYNDVFRLKSSIATLPMSILRPLEEKDVNDNRLDFLKKTKLALAKDNITEIFERMDKRLKHLQKTSAFDKIITFAKAVSRSLVKHFDIKFTILRSSLRFYSDIQHVFQKTEEPGVIIFSTTPGIFIPQEHWGFTLVKRLTGQKDHELKDKFKKDPSRRSLWVKGIIHGARNGCKIRYQINLPTAIKSFIEGFKLCAKFDMQEKYEKEAEDILAMVLETPNIEIRFGEFGEELSDFRSWLTYASNEYVLISARPQWMKERIHGLLIDRNFFDQMMWGTLKTKVIPDKSATNSILDYSLELYNKGKTSFGGLEKSFEPCKKPREVAKRFITWIKKQDI